MPWSLGGWVGAEGAQPWCLLIAHLPQPKKDSEEVAHTNTCVRAPHPSTGHPHHALYTLLQAAQGPAAPSTEQQPEQQQPHAWEAFGEVVEYALRPRCRRATLLAHFGETLPAGGCQGCDVCTAPQVNAACSSTILVHL